MSNLKFVLSEFRCSPTQVLQNKTLISPFSNEFAIAETPKPRINK